MNKLETRFGPWRDTGLRAPGTYDDAAVFDGFVRGYVTSRFGVRRPPRAEHTGADIGTFRRPSLVLVPGSDLRIDRVGDEHDAFADIFGNHVIFETPEGYWLLMAHFSELDPAVRPGATLPLGSRLGLSGETGDAEGIHIHIGLAYPDNPGLNTFRGGGLAPGTSRLQGLLDPLDYFVETIGDWPAPDIFAPEGIFLAPGRVYLAPGAVRVDAITGPGGALVEIRPEGT